MYATRRHFYRSRQELVSLPDAIPISRLFAGLFTLERKSFAKNKRFEGATPRSKFTNRLNKRVYAKPPPPR